MPLKKLKENIQYQILDASFNKLNNSNTFNNCTITTTGLSNKKETKNKFDLKPTNIIFNNPATIVHWNDGTKTVVKIMEGDTYDETYGVAMCYTKKIFGSNSKFKKMIDGFIKKQDKIKFKKDKKTENKINKENKIYYIHESNNINIGDKVICINDKYSFDCKNKIGTVVHIYNDGYADGYTINFDNDVRGWGDSSLGIKGGHGLNLDNKDIKKIIYVNKDNESKVENKISNDSSDEPKFNVGDRVYCISRNTGYPCYGEQGTICDIIKHKNQAIVNFDVDIGGWSDKDLCIEYGHGLYIYLYNLELLNNN
jgi:hypothetical protein